MLLLIYHLSVYIYCLNLVRRLHNYRGGKSNDRFSICKDEIHVACGFLGFPLLFFFPLLVVVGTLCKGKRKEVKVIDRNMFPGLILQREGTESEKKECISVFYIVQYIKEERRKKIFGGTWNAGRSQQLQA